MTNEEIAALSKLNFCAGRQIADFAAKEGRLEKKAFKILFGGKRRSVNFYRPMDTKCQQRANTHAKP